MELNEYQEKAGEFATLKDPDLALREAVFGFLEEAGEVAGKFKRLVRGDNDEQKTQELLKKELGDCLWYLSQLSYCVGFTLEEIAVENLEKLTDRRNRNMIKGEGDLR